MPDAEPNPGASVAGASIEECGDRELLARYARERSQEAFALLVERHIAAVRSTCRENLGPGHGWLDDATQAVFLILARRGAELRDARALPAWLRTTARGVCANIRRAERRRRDRERDVAVPDAAPAPGPQGLEQADLRAQLEQAISALTEAQREAVVRHFLQNKRQAEVAAELGVSEGAVKKRIADAMVTLRAAFQGRGTALPSVLALGLGDDGIPPQLLERCIASGSGGGSAQAKALAAAFRARALAPKLMAAAALVAALALGAFALGHARSSPAARPNAAAPAQDPAAAAILGPIHALRANDLHALLACLPAREQERIARDWAAFASTPSPLSDALADAGLALVRRTRSSDDLLPYYHPLTDDLLLDLRQMSARARGRGLAEQARVIGDLARDLHGYLTTIDVRDRAVERAVVAASLATGRRWGFRTVDQARHLPFDEVVERLGGILASVKRWWMPYGLDVDAVLGSVVVDAIHGSGEERTAHVHFTAFGHPYALALGVRRTAGVWECPELEGVMDQALGDISHYFYLPPAIFAPQPAAPTQGDPDDPVPLARPEDLRGAPSGSG